jgi:hypothetical protein
MQENETYMGQINPTPLYKKIGIEEGYNVKLINEPEYYSELLRGLSCRVIFHKRLFTPVDLIHLFTKSKKELFVELPQLKKFIKSSGMIWVSWPKKTSDYISDLDENVIRKIGLESGLVDTMICSIDDFWSALKFVYRTEDRT